LPLYISVMCNLYGITKIKRPSGRSCARFGAATIYDEPHKLRKYRNKVHIQTDVDIKDVSRDEPAAFSKTIVDWSLGLIVRVLSYLNATYSRPKDLGQYAHELSIPSS
jgi:hypothetical protein